MNRCELTASMMNETRYQNLSQKAAFAAFCVFGYIAITIYLFTPAAHAQTDTEPDATTTAAVAPVPAGIPAGADVYQVTQLTGDQDFGDFLVGPGKFDLQLAPGESDTVLITVTNRTGIEKVFSLTAEDMTGSDNPEQPTVLLGDDRGPYTLKDYLSVAADRFTLQPGERATIPVTVSLPTDAEPGGRYGSLLVQTATRPGETETQASAAVVSRIAVLFFITTPGELNQEGSFTDFTTVPTKTLYSEGPITFGLMYENTGTVHTNPAGEILIHNMLGQQVGYVEVTPWFSLPDSLRVREVTWEREALLGRYEATARVYLGYGDEIETRTLTFWVIDWLLIGAVALGLLALYLLVRFVTHNFSLSRKR